MDELHHEKEVENIIKEAVHTELESLERAPEQKAWQQVSQKLGQPKDAGAGNGQRRGIRAGWIRYLGIAAAVVLFIGAGIWASRAITDPAHDFAGKDVLVSDKYEDSGPETVEEGAEDLTLGSNADEADISPKKTTEDSGSAGGIDRTMGSDRDMDHLRPPRAMGQFKLAGPSRPEAGGTSDHYLYTDGDRELLFLVIAPGVISGEEPIYGRDDEYISPDFLEELHQASTVNAKDNLGKSVMAWTDKDRTTYILWSQSDDITAGELRRLYRKASLPDSRRGNP